jgi:hypothetical protein
MMDEQIHNEPPQGKRNQSWTSRKMDYIDAANLSLAGAPFKVAVCIIQHANRRTEQAWPTQQTIATKTGLKLPTVKKAVAKAVRDGWIERRTVWKEGKTYNVTIRWQNVQAAFDKLTEERITRKTARVIPFEPPKNDGPADPAECLAISRKRRA